MKRSHVFLGVVATLCLTVSGQTLADSSPAEPTVSINFVGDIMLAGALGKTIKRGRDPFAPFASILDVADIVVGNLECVVAVGGMADPEKPFSFRAHPRVLRVLKRHFDVLVVANNHSGDFGPIAFSEMLDLLERQDIAYVGGGATLAQAHTPRLIERKGLRVALLGYNEFFPRSFEADYDRPGVAWSEDEQVKLDITTARARYRADLVIPVMHWGWEHEALASQRQRQLARLMIDAGADAVVGGHPHVTQDIEHYNGKPIIYSLGNFVFDGFSDQDNNTGWLLQMELDRRGVRGWRTFVARIDRHGIPHPAARSEGFCWVRGQDEALICGVD